MPTKTTKSAAELEALVQQATADYEAAKADYNDATNWYHRQLAADRMKTAHALRISYTEQWLTACAHEAPEDTVEYRVDRVTDLLADAGVYAGKSPNELAWALEEAGVLK